jgi:glucose/galactose transporter
VGGQIAIVSKRMLPRDRGTMDADAGTTRAEGFGPVLTIGVLFFIFGFVTWLNGPLISFVKLAFDIDDVGAFLVPMAFYLSYFFLALPCSAILRRTGMKTGMALGLLIMAVGAVIFGHSTTSRYYPGALTGLFVIGAGLSLLQTASNPYVIIVGPMDSAARRIAVMGICNKFAGILAPFVFGVLVLSGFDNFEAQVAGAATPEAKNALLSAFAGRVYGPYMVMAGLLALLGVWIARSNLPEVRPEGANEETRSGEVETGLLAYPHLWLGVLALFLYVGVEVMAGDAIGVYGAGFGLALEETKFFTSYTLFAMLLGYIAGLIVIPKVVSQERYLVFSAALGVVLTILATLATGYSSVALIASLGFANAMMWPAIFPLAIRGLGRHTETGAAMLIMSIAGGALMPYAFALLKQYIDFQLAYAALAVPAYLFILYYGARGHAAR